MLNKILVGILVSSVGFGNVSAGGIPWTQEDIEYFNPIDSVSEFCPNNSRDNRRLYDENIAEKVKEILYKFDYEQIKIISNKVSKIGNNYEEKMIRIELDSDIEKYIKKYISKDIYDKGHNFLNSFYETSNKNYDSMIAIACYPYAILGFKGVGDNRIFTSKEEYLHAVLISTVTSVIRYHLETEFYPSTRYNTKFTLYGLDGIKLGENTQGYYDKDINDFGKYTLNDNEYLNLTTEYNTQRISQLIGKKYTKNISGFKKVKNPKYEGPSCEMNNLFNDLKDLGDSQVNVFCEPVYISEEMNFKIEIEILPKY